MTNDITELLINSYYNIVKRTMIDMVPKAIMLNLVQYVPHKKLKTNQPLILILLQIHQR